LILRRKVKDVAKDLPARVDIPVAIELDDQAAAMYEELRTSSSRANGRASLELFIRLRQFCTHPFLIRPSDGDPAMSSTKYSHMVSILEEIFMASDKVLIFTSFQAMSDLLARDLKRRFQIPVLQVDGRTPVFDRQLLVDQLHTIKTSAAMILNPRAAGVGLNITTANHVVHYNLEWNPAVEDQATARAYRRGAKRPVNVHKLFHASTVEEIINHRLNFKRTLINRAIVGHDGQNDMRDILRALELSPIAKGKTS
jgi:SNF2 family DNA or RNA helicase